MGAIKESTTSIDSLSLAVNGIEEKLIQLEKSNQTLRDSISSLTKHIEKAGIKTEFFSDQLSFQLFFFTLILAAIGIISWRAWLTPLANKVDGLTEKLDKINNDTIPSFDKQINEDISLRHEKLKEIIDELEMQLENQIYEISDSTFNANILALESMSKMLFINNRYEECIYYKLKDINYRIDNDRFDFPEGDNSIVKNLIFIEELIINKNIEKIEMTSINFEIFNILNGILKEECHHDIKTITKNIINILFPKTDN